MEDLFEGIKHIAEDNYEYLSARELMPLLEYTLLKRFSIVIKSIFVIAFFQTYFAIQIRKLLYDK